MAIRRTPLVLVAALALHLIAVLACASTASAHAVLIESSPADGAMLSVPPAKAVLRFNSLIEGRVTRITLVDGSGVRRELTPTDDRAKRAADTVVVVLPELGPGVYRLEYRVLATDGHATPGLVRFTVLGGDDG